ncbi:MAG TPA: hypothetical protein VGS19_19940 [Streptosporangiaceae bacterium]|nr:hypothetical protein [Streptosporangiaceae bacterium]
MLFAGHRESHQTENPDIADPAPRLVIEWTAQLWDALMGLTEIRNVLARGATFGGREYLAARKRYSDLMTSLGDAMRLDLDVPPLPGSFTLKRPGIGPGPQPPAGSRAECLWARPRRRVCPVACDRA